ncbi:plexin domain-containing protein 2 [Sitophilus oryzae]|uniref:Plexin domain-containing protein 2 n=1 Tax=Sitophilus oryzae TaxID=7048 RepID=A0A6J2Y3X9_SITOR|nr:plexin domain-containing protein 2 [Sitophilus oryzae]
MARDRYVSCVNFCVCLCVFVFFSISCAASDSSYYYYKTIPFSDVSNPSYYGGLVQFDQISSQRHRRDLENLLELSTQSSNVTKSILPEKKHQENSAETEKSVNTKDLNVRVIHNLGVNGTGQRKNITELHQQPVPVPVHMVNTLVNTPLKNLTMFLGEAEEELPDILPDAPDNSTLESQNITMKTDTHIFYNSTIYNNPDVGKTFWVDLSKRSDVKVNELLSNSYRRAATIKLSFDFPFYGHYIKNVTVATGGFLYTGNYVHSWLAATQYIAPLMANFDTSLSNDSYIKFVDNGTSFTVEWERVILQDKRKDGEFTFQTTLHKNGDIVFAYKNVPLLIEDINDDFHPVKVGLSDAYILDRTIFFVRRKTIYEYHRVAFTKEEIKNLTAIYLKALPTCLDFHNCSSCVNAELSLECKWCPTLNQCSTGKDRNRQEWIDRGCEARNISQLTKCDGIYEESEYINNSPNYDVERGDNFDNDYIGKMAQQNQLGASGYIAVIFLIAMVCGFGFWTAYAYRNPHTTSGQILIRYRPSQWRWRRGEARYTAATIHM